MSRSTRIWVAAAAVTAGVGALVRVHNAFAFPPFGDYDGMGHALHVFAWFQGRLPDPRSWSGFHPPLYYATGALLWHVLPEAVPVHAALRLLSALCGALAVWVAWRALRPVLPEPDAALVAVLAWCVPAVSIATSMTGNETMATLFVTLGLARSVDLRRRADRPHRHALGTGALLGLGALTKSTAFGAVAACALAYAWSFRREPRRLVATVGVLVAAAVLISAPHYARLMLESGGSPLSAVSAAAVSPEVRAVMAEQPPQERRLAHYFSLPPATLFAPVYRADGMTTSVPGLLYASFWADGHLQFLVSYLPVVLRAQVAMALLGLLPTALFAVGALRVLRRPRAHAAWTAPLLFLGIMVAAFLVYSWTYPAYSAIKASYLLPALLPGCYVLAQGVASTGGSGRVVVRAGLLLVALAASGLTWWGWWR